MRTKSAQTVAILANPSHVATAIVFTVDVNGDPVQVDNVIEVDINESIDSFATATVSIQRQVGKYSVAPLVTGSGNPIQQVDPLLQVGRVIEITSIVQPADSNNESFPGIVVFSGYIDDLEWSDDVIKIGCSDNTAALRDKWIEWERAYGLCTGAAATSGAFIWNDTPDARTLQVGDLVVPSKLRSNGHFYRVTSANAAAFYNEPASWPTASGATTSTPKYGLQEVGLTSNVGTPVETIIQQILNDNGLGGFVLQTPVSPGWTIRPYVQSRSSVLDAVQTFAEQIGWRLVFKWSTTLGAMALTFYAPDRTGAAGSVKTIRQDEEIECSELGIDVMSIRNAVRIIYSESSIRDGEGNAVRQARVFTNPASIAKYGRRFMEIAESSSSNIDTITEATLLGTAAVADLCEPTVGISVEFPIDPYLEVGDMVTIPADGLRFSSDQTLATESINSNYKAEAQTTKITIRGLPVARRMGWFENAGGTGDSIHVLQDVNMQTPIFALVPTVGGTRLGVSGTKQSRNRLEEKTEIHLSQTSGFTPDQTTVVAVGATPVVEMANLNPGERYYAKAVPYSHNARQKVRGPPSEEISFVAGRAKQAHYDSASTQSHLPLNGNFEHFFAGLGKPPDHWNVAALPGETEGWGSGGSVWYFQDASKGFGIDLRPNSGQRGRIVSDVFEVRRGVRALNIYLSLMRLGSSAVSGKDLIVDVFGFNDAALTTQVINFAVFLSGSASGPFPSINTWYDTVIDFGAGYGPIPSNVNFLQIALRRSTAGDASFNYRIGDVYVQEADFFRLKVDTLDYTAPTQPYTAVAVPTATSWLNNSGYAPIGYALQSGGIVSLRGTPRFTGASLAGNQTLFTLPVGYRPAYLLQFPVRCGNGALSYVQVSTTGAVTFGSSTLADASSSVTLDGISFSIAP